MEASMHVYEKSRSISFRFIVTYSYVLFTDKQRTF